MIKIIKQNNTIEYFCSDRNELSKSEEKLNDNIVLKTITKKAHKTFENYKMILIPYMNYKTNFFHKGEINMEDICMFRNYTSFAKYKLDKVGMHNEIIYSNVLFINLDNIPQQYDYFDIFVYGEDLYPNKKDKEYDIRSISFSLYKEKLKSKRLFSYEIGLDKAIYGIMLGTFGRLERGWKFYPKFKEMDIVHNDLLKKYLGRLYCNVD